MQEITFQELAVVERLLLDVHLRFHHRHFTHTVIYQHYTELNMSVNNESAVLVC